jgi:hypothetical protein
MQELSKKRLIDDCLRRIANILMINASFTENLGLLNGKMGIAIFFYHYFRYTNIKIYDDYAGELLDEIYQQIKLTTPVDFANGLTGIGWGIEYLVKQKFVQADTDETLEDIDSLIYRKRLESPILISNGDDFFGYGLYYLVRLINHKIDDNNLNTLIKKYHLIFLTDECERILLMKHYQRFGIDSLSIDTINSFIWFLLEMERLQIFPFKIKKVLNCLPEYSIEILRNAELTPNRILLIRLTEKAVEVVTDNNIVKNLGKILKTHNTIAKPYLSESNLISDFCIKSWQSLIYRDDFINDKERQWQISDELSYLEEETNWKFFSENIKQDNLGLTGLAGLGLGLIFNVIKVRKVTERS